MGRACARGRAEAALYYNTPTPHPSHQACAWQPCTVSLPGSGCGSPCAVPAIARLRCLVAYPRRRLSSSPIPFPFPLPASPCCSSNDSLQSTIVLCLCPVPCCFCLLRPELELELRQVLPHPALRRQGISDWQGRIKHLVLLKVLMELQAASDSAHRVVLEISSTRLR